VIPGLTAEETAAAVEAGYRALTEFNARLRRKGREVLEWCARANRGCLMVLARPYHMDPGIGHEIEVDLQASGYSVLWAQYFPIDDDLMQWAFGPDMQQIVERSGTLFFSFQDLDSTKPAGSVKIRVETHRPLPREVRGRHHPEEDGGHAARLPAAVPGAAGIFDRGLAPGLHSPGRCPGAGGCSGSTSSSSPSSSP
jgi:predicted nucleotide-binding protein (sugar kinase/HSP70/actin superfamily)